MRVRRLFLIVISLVVMTSINVRSQEVKDFRQPYPLGEKNDAFAQYFIGQSYLAPISKENSLNVPMHNVTFEPSCRNNWHKHNGGQILIATAGVGYYQQRGKTARRLYPGDVVEIAPNVEHWHGAAPDEWFAHISISCNPTTAPGTTWLERVEDKQYLEACEQSKNVYSKQNSALTNRQQAIVSVGNYTAQGNLFMLKKALVNALENNLTINEIKDLLTQAYAYCGFPRSLRAITTFEQVLNERKAQGINDKEGKQATPINNNDNKYLRGATILEQLTGVSKDAPKGSTLLFDPEIDTFLKEHLFCDIFERDVLAYKDRELFTVSLLSALGGVEPMAKSHISMCLHIGLTKQQINALLNITETNVGKFYTDPVRKFCSDLLD
jgi:4-carboxymuconolactone decarboxylase